MSDKEELKKVENFIKKLYQEGKTTEEIKKELIKKGAPKDIINKLIALVNEEETSDDTNKFIISGKSVNKIKELLLKRFDTKFFYKKIYTSEFNLKESSLFILLADYYTLSHAGAVAITLISEFVKDSCTITVVISGARDPIYRVHIWSISELEKEIINTLKEISTQNGWNFKQIKFRKKSILEG